MTKRKLSHGFKLFTKLLSGRLYRYVENKLPDEQYGFIKGRSTTDAIRRLREAVKSHLSVSRMPLYAVFVDFKKAFDCVPRRSLIRKLAIMYGIKGRMLRILLAIYSYNLIKVFDGILFSDPILQSIGAMQGDSLSPLIFLLYVSDLPGCLCAVLSIGVIMYADDLVFYSTSLESVQKATDVLYFYCQLNGLEVNITKTKVMKFRRGGRLKASDVLIYGDAPLSFCKEYEYLGMMLQQTWTFTRHFQKKRAKFFTALSLAGDLQGLSLTGAVKYFDIMLRPIITYGVEAIWEDLGPNHFGIIDSCKWGFFKRVLGLHKSCKNRYIAIITGLPYLTDIYNSPAIKQCNWKGARYQKRHLVCRFSVHGFHFKLCKTAAYHERESDCKCKFCGLSSYGLLHAFECSVLSKRSLEDISNIE